MWFVFLILKGDSEDHRLWWVKRKKENRHIETFYDLHCISISDRTHFHCLSKLIITSLLDQKHIHFEEVCKGRGYRWKQWNYNPFMWELHLMIPQHRGPTGSLISTRNPYTHHSQCRTYTTYLRKTSNTLAWKWQSNPTMLIFIMNYEYAFWITVPRY